MKLFSTFKSNYLIEYSFVIFCNCTLYQYAYSFVRYELGFHCRMENTNSKRGPQKRSSKTEKTLVKNNTQAWLGAAPWGPPPSNGSLAGGEDPEGGDHVKNQKGKAAGGSQQHRKSFGNSKKQPGKERDGYNSQQSYGQRAGSGGHFWGQALQEQPQANAVHAAKSRPPKVFKQFGQDEQKANHVQAKPQEARRKNFGATMVSSQSTGSFHGRVDAGNEPAHQPSKRQRGHTPFTNPNDWLKRLISSLQNHIKKNQGKIQIATECTHKEVAAYLNNSIFTKRNEEEAPAELERSAQAKGLLGGLDLEKLQADLIDQIIMPYKSQKYSFGDFLSNFISEILKVNDQLQQTIHQRNLGQITSISRRSGQSLITTNDSAVADVAVGADPDGQTPADQAKEESQTAAAEKEERYNAFDSFLSSLLVAAFECILKKRKELLKEMPQETIKKLCHSLLSTLSYQDSVVLQIYAILKEKQSVPEKKEEEKENGMGIQMQADFGEQMISVRSVNDEVYREACLRFLSQVCFENCAQVPDESVANIYNYVSKLAFMHESSEAQKSHAESFKGNNTMFYKTLRAAFNCVANLLVQPDGGNTSNQPTNAQAAQTERTEHAVVSTFIQQNNSAIFSSLRKEFEYLMSKLQTYHRSKRFISQMTTVVRALQCSLNYNSGLSGKKLQASKGKAAHGEPGGVGTGEMVGNSPAYAAATVDGKKGKFGPGGAGSQWATGEIILPDNEAIELFVNFYKLLFLGTKFATKMLKITLNPQAKKIEMPVAAGQDGTDSESGSIIADTSDAMLSPSDVANTALGKSAGFKQGSLHLVDDSGGDQYQKIKIQANLGLKNLFSNNSKTLFNYWYIMFPSFMMRPQTELTKYLTSFVDRASAQKFAADAFKDIENKEPTMFFVVRQPSAQSQLKSQMLATFQTMLEHSQISKQRQDLEDKSSEHASSGATHLKEHTKTVSLVQMTEVLGQFLRFAHYILICLLHEEAKSAHLYPTSFNNNRLQKTIEAQQGEKEVATQFFDRQCFIQIIRTMKTLIQVTPYSLMRSGLASVMMQALIETLQTLDKISNRDQLIRNEIFIAMNQAMSKSDLIPELKASFFETKQRSELQESLINTLFKVNNFISNEKIQILQTLGKNYPEVLTYQWLKIEKGYTVPKIQNFIVQTIQKIDRKKVNLILKIIEDQLKNYQVLNQADNNDEKVLIAEIQEIQKQKLDSYQDIMRLSPYDNEVFCTFLFNTINQSILKHHALEDDTGANQGIMNRNQMAPQLRIQGQHAAKDAFATNQGQAKFNQQTGGAVPLQLGVDINTTISLLNLVCIMNQQQYHLVFKTEEQTLKLLAFLEGVLNISAASSSPAATPHGPQPSTMPTNQQAQSVNPVPSILKAAIIKTFGYLIQHKRGSSIFTKDDYVCNTIIGHCLSPSILSESNIHVQIRNSWTISFVCSLYPIEYLIKSRSLSHADEEDSKEQPESKQAEPKKRSEEVRQQKNLMLLINACVKYSRHQQSNKEKVAASSIRALGFVAQNLMLLEKKMRERADKKDDEDNQIAEQRDAPEELELDAEFIRGAICQIIEVIIGKLYSQRACTPKVLWNICVAISKIIDTFNEAYQIDADQHYTDIDYTKSLMSQIFCFKTTQCFLNIFMNGQNYKTKIHACQTLLKYRNLNQYGQLDKDMNPENLLRLFWTHIQEQLKFQINCKSAQIPAYGNTQQSAVEQSAYIEQIDQSFIDFWSHICKLTSKNLLNPCTVPQLAGAELAKYNENKVFIKDSSHHQSTMTAYFNEHALDLLQSIIQYLRRELKVPEYAQMFEFEEGDEFTQEDFASETKQIFEDSPGLYPKLQQLQSFIIGKIYEIIQQEDSEVRVSFFVFESFAKLAKSDILTEYRGLEMLRQTRNFNPSLL